jgi:hypothetical protein
VLDLLEGELRRAKKLHPEMPHDPEEWVAPIMKQAAELVMSCYGVKTAGGMRLTRTKSALHILALLHRFLTETDVMDESTLD